MTAALNEPSVSERLATGLAQHLHDAGLALYKPTGVYGKADQWGVTFYSVPQGPDQVITLTPYPIEDDVRTAVSVVGMQIRCRGPANDPRPPERRSDAIFNNLQAAEHLLLGGLVVDSIDRRSSLPMGADGSGRWEIASNYALTLNRPTLWRTP